MQTWSFFFERTLVKFESVTSYFLIDNEMFNTLTFVFKENSDILLKELYNTLTPPQSDFTFFTSSLP